jgi:hypothetical protein
MSDPLGVNKKRPIEELIETVLEIQKSINSIKSDISGMKMYLRKLEIEKTIINDKKDKEYERVESSSWFW